MKRLSITRDRVVTAAVGLRPTLEARDDVRRTVADIIDMIRRGGDDALRRLTSRLDGADLAAEPGQGRRAGACPGRDRSGRQGSDRAAGFESANGGDRAAAAAHAGGAAPGPDRLHPPRPGAAGRPVRPRRRCRISVQCGDGDRPGPGRGCAPDLRLLSAGRRRPRALRHPRRLCPSRSDRGVRRRRCPGGGSDGARHRGDPRGGRRRRSRKRVRGGGQTTAVRRGRNRVAGRSQRADHPCRHHRAGRAPGVGPDGAGRARLRRPVGVGES